MDSEATLQKKRSWKDKGKLKAQKRGLTGDI